ncbi:TPA: hypothetical protein NNW70_004293 [Salmonella enterica]|nr:hypothetical protein [Salmonella enterica]HCH9608003.1 hypothetical protein [Salmonella enterica]HDI5000297.1 hypothetical protein [Salmonella enterica]
MSNVETKRIRHTNYVQFLLEVQELIQNGWSFVANGSATIGGVQFTANFQRSTKQSEEAKEVVKKEVVKEESAETQQVETAEPAKTPVKASVKTQTAKTTTKK